jgi:hypothetical protein
MPWLKFFAAPDDFPPFFEQLLIAPRRLFEVYSEPGQKSREFFMADATLRSLLGQDPDGNGVRLHLALWAPEIMPAPGIRRIVLRGPEFPPGSWRESVEGCGLFWLQTGGLHADAITASSLGWFTQRAAARQCTVEPGPDSVNWAAHAALAASLKRVVRQLAVARAGQHGILPDALTRHRAGARLILGRGLKQEFRVAT